MEIDALTIMLLTTKAFLYATALVAVGVSLHLTAGIIEQDGRRRAMSFAAAAALTALLLATIKLLIINAQLGGGIQTAFDPDSFAWTWRAQRWTTLAIAAGAAAILIAVPTRNAWIGGLGGMFIALSFALTGHSQSQELPGFISWAVAMHVLIAGFWFAAPLTLWPREALSNSDLVARLERFSQIALLAVPILFALGFRLAWQIAGGYQPLMNSVYGRLLLLKLAVAAVALAIGAQNKFFTTPIVARDPVRGRNRLKKSLTWEAVAFATAIIIVDWVTTVSGPPET